MSDNVYKKYRLYANSGAGEGILWQLFRKQLNNMYTTAILLDHVGLNTDRQDHIHFVKVLSLLC
jgi:hypothetical protein